MATGTTNSIENARRLLEKCTLFRGLPTEDRDRLIARARIRHFAAGQTIFTMGARGDSMLAVLNGEVRISVPSYRDRELQLAILQPGEVFGEIAVLDGKERTADAQAITDCDLAVLKRADILDFLRRDPNALASLVEVLCGRLRQTDQHIAEVALLNLPVRLAKVMLRIGEPDKAPQMHGPIIKIHRSQRELANMIGAARESVNKCLREWNRSSVLRVQGNSITITKPAVLAEIADQV